MAFWQFVFLLSLVATLFLVWPLLKFPFLKRTERSQVNYDQTQTELYSEHLSDLRKALDAGDIDDAQFNELKLELQKTLVNEGEVGEVVQSNFGGKKVLLGVAIIVPVLSFFLYTQTGSKKEWEIYRFLTDELSAAKSSEEHQQKLHELSRMAQARIVDRPENMQLLNLSAQTSMALQDYDQAVDAYRKILAKHPEEPRVMASLAQVLFYRAGNVVTPEVRDYTQKTLQIAPMMPEMLGLAGIDAKNQGDYEGAMSYWGLALRQLDPNSNAAKGYRNGIARAKEALVAAGKPVPDDMALPDKADGDGEQLVVKVSLADSVSASPGDRVFIYARAWQGQKMPLAIKGDLTVKDLPVEVTLTEAMAMSPAFTLSSADSLEVVARISRSGSAVSQPGDWQATQGPVKLAAQKDPIELTIADQIP